MPAKITLSVQVEYIGRVDAFADGWGGKASGLGRLEGFTLSSDAPAWPLHVTCQAILPDGSAAPPVAGGQYCGTGRGAVPLHGFIVKISDEAGDLADITYEGIFQDGYRSGLLRPGSVCTSPENAALLAMRVNATPPADGLREGAIVRPRYPGEPPLKHVPGIVPAQLSRPPVAEPDDIWAEEMPEVTLTAHIGGRGDVAADADGWVGAPGDTHAIEGFSCNSGAPGWYRDLGYQAVQHDRSLGPRVAGGDYCGTTGRMLPLHGFVVHVPSDKPHLAGVFYEGAFADGFRSGQLRPDTVCASPGGASLVAMRIGFRKVAR